MRSRSTTFLIAVVLAVAVAGCDKPPPERPPEPIDIAFVSYASVGRGVVHLRGTTMERISITKCSYRAAGSAVQFEILGKREGSWGGSADITTQEVDCTGPILEPGSYDADGFLRIVVSADGTGSGQPARDR